MGAWGVSAFKSDTGLDGIGMIRRRMGGSGKLDLSELIPLLDTGIDTYGHSHTKHMALAELMVKFADHDLKGVDYEDDPPALRFDHVTEFTADKGAIRWMKIYLWDMLKNSRAEAPARLKWEKTYGGWFQEKDWIDWQKHMENLIGRMDQLLNLPGNQIDLVNLPSQQTMKPTNSPVMRM